MSDLSPEFAALLAQAHGDGKGAGTAPKPQANALSPAFADLLDQAAKPKVNPNAGKLTGPLANFGAGANDIISGVLGAPVDAITYLATHDVPFLGPKLPQNLQALNNKVSASVSNPVGGSEWWKRLMGDIGANPENVAAATPVDKLARAAGAGTASMLVPIGGAPESVGALARLGGVGAVSGASGKEAENVAPAQYRPVASVIGNLVGGGLTAGAASLAKLGAAPFKSAETVGTRVLDKFAGGVPGAGNDAEIVPGSAPTLAESTGNAKVAGFQRALRDINPQPFVEREQKNAAARKNYLATVAKTPEDIESATAAREEATGPARQAAFANAGEANPAYVNRAINRILASPSGQRDVVQRTLQNVQSKLFVDNPISDRISRAIGPINDALAAGDMSATRQADFQEARRLLNSATRGNTSEEDLVSGLKKLADKQKIVGPIDNALGVIKEGKTKFQTDPAQLYGIRQSITDMLSPLAAGTGSDARLAARELGVVKTGIDNAIEKAAPGFKNYLQTYSSMSRPIDQMRFLQGLNLTDAKGNITLAKVQNALRNIGKMQGAKGMNPAKSLTPEQIGVLTSIRDDLLREQNLGLGKSVGSPTVQNAINQYGLGKAGIYAGKSLPLVGAYLGATFGHHLPLGPEIGAAIGTGIGEVGSRAMASRAANVRSAMERMMLNPGANLAPLPAPRPSAARYLYRQGLLALPRQTAPVSQGQP